MMKCLPTIVLGMLVASTGCAVNKQSEAVCMDAIVTRTATGKYLLTVCIFNAGKTSLLIDESNSSISSVAWPPQADGGDICDSIPRWRDIRKVGIRFAYDPIYYRVFRPARSPLRGRHFLPGEDHLMARCEFSDGDVFPEGRLTVSALVYVVTDVSGPGRTAIEIRKLELDRPFAEFLVERKPATSTTARNTAVEPADK